MSESPPPIVGENLNYMAPPAVAAEFGMGAWISTLVVGIVEVAGASCAGLGLVAVLVWPGASRALPRTPSLLHWVLLVASIIYVALPMGTGITKLVCALKLKRGSWAALITAFIVTITQIGGAILLVGRVLQQMALGRTRSTPGLESVMVLIGIVVVGWIVHLGILAGAWLRNRARLKAGEIV